MGFGNDEVPHRELNPGGQRSAVGLAAHAAMAMSDGLRIAGNRPITHRAAEAAAFMDRVVSHPHTPLNPHPAQALRHGSDSDAFPLFGFPIRRHISLGI